jgi:hypothetical protein
MRNEAGHKHEIDFTVAEDLIGDVHMTALGIADRRLHGTSPVMDGEVLPKAGQVMQRWFTEGFETRDLKDAKALLQELAA